MLVRVGSFLTSNIGTGEGSSGIRPGVASLIWTGFAPTLTGVTLYASPGVGAATWTGYPPDISKTATLAPGTAAVTWTGPAPTVTGLTSAVAIQWGSGNGMTWDTSELTWGT